MHRLAELSVRRPVLASVLILGLVFLGLVSYSRLTVERWPNIDIPFVAVSVRVPGASPEEVESDVTNKIESAVNTISGIDRLSSTSAEGFAIISLQFHLEKDIDVAAQEVRDKINGVLRDLPAGIDPPVISKFDPRPSLSSRWRSPRTVLSGTSQSTPTRSSGRAWRERAAWGKSRSSAARRARSTS